MDWEKYVEEERAKQAQVMQNLQHLFDEAGMKLSDIPDIDMNAIEPEIRQQMQMKFGLKLDGIILHKPKTASAWRQRTRAIPV